MVFQLLFFHSRPFYGNVKSVFFIGFFYYFRLRACCPCLAFLAAFGASNCTFWNPQTLPNRPPNRSENASPFCYVQSPKFASFWGPFGHPKTAPKSLPGPWGCTWLLLNCILVASAPPHDHFGCSWAPLDPPGGRFLVHFGPSWARFGSAKAQFGTTEGLDLKLSL